MGRPKEDRVVLAQYEEEDSYLFQREMQVWMQRRKQQRGFWSMQIQDVETTNALLAKLDKVGSIWSYNWVNRGQWRTATHHQLVDRLLRNASKRMPLPREAR